MFTACALLLAAAGAGLMPVAPSLSACCYVGAFYVAGRITLGDAEAFMGVGFALAAIGFLASFFV